jgi:hypothetical protein
MGLLKKDKSETTQDDQINTGEGNDKDEDFDVEPINLKEFLIDTDIE